MSNARHLGKYQLVAEIARGGMGVVYLAINSGLAGFSKVLVVKELKPELVEEQSFLDMFLEEARLAAQLSHPNIVTTYEVGMDGKRPFIVMDYLEGQTLARVLKKAGDKVTLNMQLRGLVAALEGLQYAHTREALDGTSGSVVHRDVSPQNIFITYDGQVKVVDFGIAKASDTTIETRAGTFKGKPSYMSPQQLRGEPDGRADVFSIGVILWEALAKRRMWPNKTDVEVLTALLKSEIPSIDEIAPNQPAELRRIATKAVKADVDEQYPSARAMVEDLNSYLASINDKTSLGDFGTAVAGAFGEERTKVRRLVEKAISDSKSGPSSSPARLPSIAPPPDEGSQPSGQRVRPDSLPSSVTPATHSQGTPGGAAIALSGMQPQRGEEQRGGTPRWAIAAVLILLLIGVGFLGKMAMSGKTDTAVAKSDPTAAPPAASSAVPAPAPQPVVTEAAQPSAIPSAKPAAATAAPKVVYVPVPVHTAAVAKPVTAASAKTDCNPPFYFDGTKKIFKPGCL